tara:strand:+ start:924 stop:2834 length:1911 start_codon:yes stop_codon:yes gene_type:complete
VPHQKALPQNVINAAQESEKKSPFLSSKAGVLGLSSGSLERTGELDSQSFPEWYGGLSPELKKVVDTTVDAAMVLGTTWMMAQTGGAATPTAGPVWVSRILSLAGRSGVGKAAGGLARRLTPKAFEGASKALVRSLPRNAPWASIVKNAIRAADLASKYRVVSKVLDGLDDAFTTGTVSGKEITPDNLARTQEWVDKTIAKVDDELAVESRDKFHVVDPADTWMELYQDETVQEEEFGGEGQPEEGSDYPWGVDPADVEKQYTETVQEEEFGGEGQPEADFEEYLQGLRAYPLLPKWHEFVPESARPWPTGIEGAEWQAGWETPSGYTSYEEEAIDLYADTLAQDPLSPPESVRTFLDLPFEEQMGVIEEYYPATEGTGNLVAELKASIDSMTKDGYPPPYRHFNGQAYTGYDPAPGLQPPDPDPDDWARDPVPDTHRDYLRQASEDQELAARQDQLHGIDSAHREDWFRDEPPYEDPVGRYEDATGEAGMPASGAHPGLDFENHDLSPFVSRLTSAAEKLVMTPLRYLIPGAVGAARIIGRYSGLGKDKEDQAGGGYEGLGQDEGLGQAQGTTPGSSYYVGGAGASSGAGLPGGNEDRIRQMIEEQQAKRRSTQGTQSSLWQWLDTARGINRSGR